MEIDLIQYLTTETLILVPFLYIIGVFIKKSTVIRDNAIPSILVVLGGISGIMLLGVSFNSVVQGVLASGVAVLSNQLYKQARKD